MTAPGDESETPEREGDERDDSTHTPPPSERDPLEEVLGEETLTGPETTRPDSDESRSSPDTGPANPPPESIDSLSDEYSRESDTASEEKQEASRQAGEDSPSGRPPPIRSSGGLGDEQTGGSSADEWKLFTKDVVTSVLAVALLGMYLFAISGVWPPMVAIESGSMEPNMDVNDLVFLMDNERFQPSDAQAGTGIVTAHVGAETGYENYGDGGDVIVFEPDGNENTTPIIHRAMFWVEEGENWCEEADPAYLGTYGTDDDRCTAANDGFITKGDNNNKYDQASSQAEKPVKTEWVVGTAEVRFPRLGWFRLQFQ